MNRILVLLSFMFVVLIHPAYAHVGGVPVFTVNGVYTEVNPLERYRPSVFNIPANSDIAPGPYVVHQQLTFEIDTTKFPANSDILAKTPFTWDFGDGSAKEVQINGTKNLHTYTKTGTFLLTITADYAKAGFPEVGIQTAQAVLLHILPRDNYVLPQAIISVNGEAYAPDQEEIIDASFKNPVQLDASKSLAGTGRIISYEWDLGDGKKSTERSEKHQFESTQYSVAPVLRVRDENGFTSDVALAIKNNQQASETNGSMFTTHNMLIVLFGGIMVVSAILLLIKRPKKRKKK